MASFQVNNHFPPFQALFFLKTPWENMQRYLLAVDRISTFIGKTFSWCIAILTVVVCYDVFLRYALSAPTLWAFDVSYMLYGALFMMAGAYTLALAGHVRGDFL